jgi:hypothetical protein
MRLRKSNKSARKRLRYREGQLQKYLDALLKGHDPDKPFDERSFDEKSNYRLLLKLRWLVTDFIYLRLKLHPEWQTKEWFLELFDVDEIRIGANRVTLKGDIVWWAEGKDAVGQWWPAGHEPHWVGQYKIKIRGDLNGGYWLLEPLVASLRMPTRARHNADYEIEFGQGSTYMKPRSKGWR